MKTQVTQTSMAAYHSLKNLTEQQQEILTAIKTVGVHCIADIAAYLNWEKSTVAARLNELKKLGLIFKFGKYPSRTTGITAEFWREKTPETLFAI